MFLPNAQDLIPLQDAPRWPPCCKHPQLTKVCLQYYGEAGGVKAMGIGTKGETEQEKGWKEKLGWGAPKYICRPCKGRRAPSNTQGCVETLAP